MMHQALYGATISITAKMTEVQGRKVLYDVEAYDGKTCIGKGKHARFIVDCPKKFLVKFYPDLKRVNRLAFFFRLFGHIFQFLGSMLDCCYDKKE